MIIFIFFHFLPCNIDVPASRALMPFFITEWNIDMPHAPPILAPPSTHSHIPQRKNRFVEWPAGSRRYFSETPATCLPSHWPSWMDHRIASKKKTHDFCMASHLCPTLPIGASLTIFSKKPIPATWDWQHISLLHCYPTHILNTIIPSRILHCLCSLSASIHLSARSNRQPSSILLPNLPHLVSTSHPPPVENFSSFTTISNNAASRTKIPPASIAQFFFLSHNCAPPQIVLYLCCARTSKQFWAVSSHTNRQKYAINVCPLSRLARLPMSHTLHIGSVLWPHVYTCRHEDLTLTNRLVKLEKWLSQVTQTENQHIIQSIHLPRETRCESQPLHRSPHSLSPVVAHCLLSPILRSTGCHWTWLCEKYLYGSLSHRSSLAESLS